MVKGGAALVGAASLKQDNCRGHGQIVEMQSGGRSSSGGDFLDKVWAGGSGGGLGLNGNHWTEQEWRECPKQFWQGWWHFGSRRMVTYQISYLA